LKAFCKSSCRVTSPGQQGWPDRSALNTFREFRGCSGSLALPFAGATHPCTGRARTSRRQSLPGPRCAVLPGPWPSGLVKACFEPRVWVQGFWFGFALRCVAWLCAVYVRLHLALFPAGGPFLRLFISYVFTKVMYNTNVNTFTNVFTMAREEEAAAKASCEHTDTQARIKHARIMHEQQARITQTPRPSGCQSPAGTPAQADWLAFPMLSGP
jgi:hypothetical protein